MEPYLLSPNPSTGKNFVIFNNAPFKLSTLSLSVTATAKTTSAVSLGVLTELELGVDFFPAFLFNQATAELGEPVYGGVLLVDGGLEGTLQATYSALGSQYVAQPTAISAIYGNDEIEPGAITWEEAIAGLPTFPHTPLNYDADALVTVVEVQEGVDALAVAVVADVDQKSIFNFYDHINISNNPHNLTAEDVDLGRVPNWSVGNAASVISGGSNAEFATPLALRDATITVFPVATSSLRGLLQLNLGTTAGDPTNNTDGLTASGLIYMLENELIDSGAGLTDNQRQAVIFDPFPIPYPATWEGHVCNTFEQLVQAVEEETGIRNLTAHAATGTVYFPHTATAPDLTLS